MLKIAFRYVIRNKRRSVTSVFGIAFSIMLMFSLIQMGDCIKCQFQEMVTAGIKRDITVLDLSYKQLLSAKEILQKNNHQDDYMITMNVAQWYESDSVSTEIVGVEGNINYFKDVSLVEGKLPAEKYEVCIEKSWNESQEKPYAIGDTISTTLVSTLESEKELQVQFKVVGILSNNVDGLRLIWTNLETANLIFQDFGDTNYSNNAIAIVSDKEKYDIDKMIEMENLLATGLGEDDFYTEHVIVNEEKEALYGEEGSYYGMASGIKSITIILGICMIIFVFNAYYINAIEKMKQFAIMRCIGLSKKQQNKILALEGLLLGNIGVLLGFLGGNILNNIVASRIVDYIMLEDVHISVHQLPSSYMETYLLGMGAIVVAIGIVIWRLHRCSIIEAMYFNDDQLKTKKADKVKEKHVLWNMAKKNITRNALKSNTLVITLTISIILTLVVFQVFFSIRIDNDPLKKEKIFTYQVYSEDIIEDEIPKVDQMQIMGMAGAENVYTQTFYREWQSEKTAKNGTILIAYDNAIFSMLLKAQKIEDWDYENTPYALYYSPEKDKADEVTFINEESGEEIKIDIAKSVFEGENYVQYTSFGIELNIVIINEKMAETLGITMDQCTGMLIKKNSDIEVSTINSILTENIYLSELDVNSEKAQEQLYGMVLIAVYIMCSIVSLTCVISSTTIQSNIYNRKKEYAIMRALGLTKKRCLQLCGMEYLCLYGKAFAIGAFLSTVICFGLNGYLDNGIKWNIGIFIGVFLFYGIVIEGIANAYMRKQLNQDIANIITEE